jgi:site-specific recombinase XerD
MTDFSITPVLKKKFATDKEGIIQIRITKERKSKYISLKERIKEQYWNKNRNEVRTSYQDHERLTNLINEKIKEFKFLYGETKSTQSVIQNLKGSFLAFFDEQIEFLFQRKRLGTYKSYKTSLFHLKSYLSSRGKEDLNFSDLQPSFIVNFETYLLNKSINNNSCKKYISTIKKVYNEAVKMKVFIPTSDPFVMFENKRVPVEKSRLGKADINKIMEKSFLTESTLYHTKNYFLFQTFAQGLRVSDLLTLRWSNLKDGHIVFVQRKTNKRHLVILNDMVILILQNYTDDKAESINKIKYSFSLFDKEYKMTYQEVKDQYKAISKQNISKFISGDKQAIKVVEGWKKMLDQIWLKVKYNLIIYLNEYAHKNPTKFIFPILDSYLFDGVVFDSNTTLSKEQYNHILSRTTIYNKQLKRLQKACDIEITLTSHIPRHTYTNLMIELTNRDIYTISKTLGHSRLSTTDHYIDDFNLDKISDDLNSLSSEFNFI